MRVQVITPFHWDGVLRVRGDVLADDAAEQIHADPHYASLCVELAEDDPHVADVPPASKPVIPPAVEPPSADEPAEE